MQVIAARGSDRQTGGATSRETLETHFTPFVRERNIPSDSVCLEQLRSLHLTFVYLKTNMPLKKKKIWRVFPFFQSTFQLFLCCCLTPSRTAPGRTAAAATQSARSRCGFLFYFIIFKLKKGIEKERKKWLRLRFFSGGSSSSSPVVIPLAANATVMSCRCCLKFLLFSYFIFYWCFTASGLLLDPFVSFVSFFHP